MKNFRFFSPLSKVYFSVILLITTVNLFSTNYYVSTTGNMTNDGLSVVNAWSTIDAAASVADAGDTVFVAYNNPEASLKMCEKLKFRRPGVNFIAPPA